MSTASGAVPTKEIQGVKPRKPLSRHGAPLRGLDTAATSQLFQGRFGRMFRGLPAASFGVDEASNVTNLTALGKAMVAGLDKPKDQPDAEESAIPALYTYLGQFIDHDITFDPASSLQKQNDPNALVDFRTPAFDLDNVYGRGPDDQPFMYEGNKLLLGDPMTGGAASAADLPRAKNKNERAIIGDPRNDENSIVSQLQGLFFQFHNRMVDQNPTWTFPQVQQAVRFHYQYVVLHDFLPRIVHSHVLSQLKHNGHFDAHKLEFYHFRNDPFMPVEFSGAAYRFGHSMVRPGYRLNNDDATLLDIFPGLTGFQKMKPGRAIDWARFVDTEIRAYGNPDAPGGAENVRRLQLAYRIDTSAVNPLGKLPQIIGGDFPSLAERNLLRSYRLGLPSGQAVARAMGVPVIEDIQIGKALVPKDPNEPTSSIVDAVNAKGGDGSVFAKECPLWTYILAEAAQNQEMVAVPVFPSREISTPKLGPVGGRIVAEVFLGLMFGDPNSMLSLDRRWKPPSGSDYKLKDFVKYALGN